MGLPTVEREVGQQRTSLLKAKFVRVRGMDDEQFEYSCGGQNYSQWYDYVMELTFAHRGLP